MKILKSYLVNFFILTNLLLSLSSCGFSPMYSKNSDTAFLRDELSAVEVGDINDRIGQQFKISLENLLNQSNSFASKKYKLDFKITENSGPFAIQQDRTVTRYKTTIVVNYNLIDLSTHQSIKSGSLNREGGYDRVESDYATYISSRDTSSRIAKELAHDLKQELTIILLDYNS